MYNYVLHLHLRLKCTLAVIYIISVNITVTHIILQYHIVTIRRRHSSWCSSVLFAFAQLISDSWCWCCLPPYILLV